MSLFDPIRIPELSPGEARYQAATMPTPFGEYLYGKLQSGFDYSISGRATEALTGPDERFGPLPQDTSPEGAALGNRRVTEDEWRKLKLDRPGLEFSGGGTVEYETARTRAFDERRYRDSLIARYQGGFLGQAAGFGAAMVGGLPSPENFIPFVGPGVRAAMVARMGTIGGRIAVGATDAAIGTALADAIVLPDLARRGEDVGAADFALDLALGAVTGGLFGAGAGVLARRAEGRVRQEMLAETARAVRLDGLERQADALELAQRALADDAPVDVGAVLEPADAALRRRLMGGTAALPETRGFDVQGLPAREALPDAVPVEPDATATVREFDPEELTFRESDQNRTEAVAEIADADELPPIVVIEKADGLEILDGHNRAAVAEQRGETVRGVALPEAAYDRLVADGFDDMEIAYAALSRAEQYDAASQLNQQFPGAGVAERGAEAERVLEEIEAPELLQVRSSVETATRVTVNGQERPDLAAQFLDRAATGREAASRFVTDYVTREAEAARHPSIIEAEASVGQAPPKTGVEEAQRLTKDMGLESPPELGDIKVLKRDGLLTAADEAALQDAEDLVHTADGWATAYDTLVTCSLRFGA